MEKNEKKKISCSYALLVVVLFATVCFLADYIVIDRKLNESKNMIINNDVFEDGNDDNLVDDGSLNVKSFIVDIDNYTNAKIDNIEVKSDFENNYFNDSISAYLNGNQVWNYSTGYHDMPQSDPFQVVGVLNDKIYIQYFGNLIVIDAFNGNELYKIDNVGFSVSYLSNDDNYLYFASCAGGFPVDLSDYMVIVDFYSNDIVKKIELFSSDRQIFYQVNEINGDIVNFNKLLLGDYNAVILENVDVKIVDLMNGSFTFDFKDN